MADRKSKPPKMDHPMNLRRNSARRDSQERQFSKDSTIRAVTPDSPHASNHSPLSEGDHLSPASSTSPRSIPRSVPMDMQPDQTLYPTSEDDYAGIRPEKRGPRGKSKTMIDDSRSDSQSLISRTRQRLGSINTPIPPTPPRPPEESTVSIGYSSMVPSTPVVPEHQLASSIAPSVAVAASGAPSVVSPESGFPSPPLNTDASKILQLMKTTCGRMHGILSFRAPGTATWMSGYCAINVTTGSLIYQAKGEAALAKTLIPDLRGCHVRTFYDLESRASCLSVSTHSSVVGVQLRPHVHETFDSWLAALLCWQPIRPKGVQNKVTKPQPVAIGERRPQDRRRNSEAAVQKDAAIIKVGKMLLWDRQNASGLQEPRVPRKSLNAKKLKNMTPSWRKVSCSLQENGHVKIYTETDVTLLHFIQLSQLSRCAIQQLDSSVLQDEFCIAIYPQYVSFAGADVPSGPIYLSLETRVLFEVWFVLLRAFTIPELYGPEQLSVTANDAQASKASYSSLPNASDMFRIERQLSIRIVEARMTSISRDKEIIEQSRNRRPTRAQTPNKKPVPAEHYAEILLDGEVRAKTAVKAETTTPFWREEFTFHDLPPVLSTASIILKSLNSSQKDWTLVNHGSFSLSQPPVNPVSTGTDVQVSSLDTTCGIVNVALGDLESGEGVEKWWPIIDSADQQVGEMLMRIQLDETIVLMSQDYEPLSELLHQFPNGLTIHISQALSSELKSLSETLLDIFQVSGQAVEWFMSLIEDEIDGVNQESLSSRLRYTSRIHSNDFFESGQDRELVVRDLGKSATIEANLLFRGNSLLTKTLDMHMRRLGHHYLEETIGSKLRDINESDPECEVDPNKVGRHEDIERNWKNLITLTSSLWTSISHSAQRCPPELRHIFRHVRACAEDRYGDFLRSVRYSSVSGFLFLRFFCPAILNPKLFGLLKDHPSIRAQRTFTLVAKALQGLANMTNFGNKEFWMEPMNKFILYHRSEFKQYVDTICSIPTDRPAPVVNPSYSTPIQILRRLPSTSREGFPSLPFLIDHPRSFSILVNLWLDSAPRDIEERTDVAPSLLKFHHMCVALRRKTEVCLSMAEQAGQPDESMGVKWEEIAEQMGKSATISEKSPDQNEPSIAESTPVPYDNDTGSRPSQTKNRPYPLDSVLADDASDDSLSKSTPGPWEGSRLGLNHRYSNLGHRSTESFSTPIASGTFSEPEGASQSGPSSLSRDSSSKYRILDFVPGARRKVKDRDMCQSQRPES